MAKQVLIICPVCHKQKRIPAPIDVIKNKETGATSVYIPSGMVCEHEFYAYIDKNLAVRDYLVLEYSLQDEAKKTEKIKNNILSKEKNYNLEIANVLNFITETDLRSLIYAGFIESPVIFIENDTNSERFGVLLNFMAKLSPKMSKNLTIFTPEKYLEYSENQTEELKGSTVYNLPFKLSVVKPFGDSNSEPLSEILTILKSGPFKLQIIYAKNFIDYLRKFADDISNEYENQRADKIIKGLKKKYPQQASYLNLPIIELLHRKNRFQMIHMKPDELSEDDIVKNVTKLLSGKLFLYNDKTHIRQAENLPSITEKLTLKLLRHNKAMSIENIISELENSEHEMSITMDYASLPDIIKEFVRRGYIESV
ncbi:MAG: hypothetical protein ACTSVU_09185 [Promethearchaeota archaeon]